MINKRYIGKLPYTENMKQRYQKRQPTDAGSVEYFVAQGVPESLAEAMNARGIFAADFQSYFGKSVFHSPFEMKNMQEAAETISFVLEEGGSVLICGDYDADGLTASSILSLFFSDNGVDNDVIIPTRDEGYGLHSELVFKAFEKKFYDLIITVDCGISNKDEVDKIIEELGAEIIVTDHHELPEVLPNCTCVNPKMGYPFPDLAGAGVAWKLVEALAGREAAAKYSQLAMIGTIGDVMPLKDENRSIVKLGLSNQNHRSLEKLAQLSKCSAKLTASEVGMKIAPKINAAGRVGDPYVALKLLLSRDRADTAIANRLLELNETRKALLQALTDEADEMCNAEKIRNERVVFLHSEKWPHGILGIAAARYKEKYNYPAVVLTKDAEKGAYVGSARGVEGIDLFDVFCQCRELLTKFGGHKASVGFSVSEDNLQPLNDRLSQILCKMPAEQFEKELFYDVDLTNDCNVSDMFDFTQKLQPLLPSDKVLFRVRDTVKFANAFGKEGNHLSATLSSGLEIKSFFKYGDYAPFIKNGADIEALISLETDDYTKTVCGIVEDMHLCNSLCFDGFYKQNFLQNFCTKRVKFATRKEVEEILRKKSVLAVFDDYETYLQQSQVFNFENYYADIFFDNSLSQNTVAVSPLFNYCFDKYEEIVCFSHGGMLRDLPKRTVFYSVEPANGQLYQLQLNRDICAAVYAKLKRKNAFESIRSVYDKYLAGKISYEQYLVAIRVFEELGLITIKDKFTVEFLTGKKADLNESTIFRCFAD